MIVAVLIVGLITWAVWQGVRGSNTGATTPPMTSPPADPSGSASPTGDPLGDDVLSLDETVTLAAAPTIEFADSDWTFEGVTQLSLGEVQTWRHPGGTCYFQGYVFTRNPSPAKNDREQSKERYEALVLDSADTIREVHEVAQATERAGDIAMFDVVVRRGDDSDRWLRTRSFAGSGHEVSLAVECPSGTLGQDVIDEALSHIVVDIRR